MPIDKEQFLKQFVKQALDERISLFLGAGGSCDAGYPNWADLFAPFARDLGTPINESTDYYRLAQYYSNSFGPGELRKRINERINRNNFESQLLEELIDIGFTNVWTTIAIQQKNRKYTYQTNFTVAVFICREYFRDRIHPSDLVALIRKNILPIREGRKAPRKVRPNSSKQLLI